MGKSKGVATTSLLVCIAVFLVAIIIMIVVGAYGIKNKENLTASSESSDTTTSVESASQPSETASSENEVTSSEITPSSNNAESSSSSKESSSQTSSIPPVISTSLPTADDNPFGIDSTEGERICYLTFDDGPGSYTESILQTLADNDVKGTFFVVGTMGISKIKSIYDAGHAIGLHTNTHELNKIYASADAFIKDLTAVSDVVYNKTGIRSNLTRFPGGSTTAYNKLGKSDFETVKETLKEKGYTYFDWNVDSGDTHSKSPSQTYVLEEIRDHLKYNGELRGEVCILMHDIKKVSSQVLDEVIKELKEQGYVFKTLDSTCNNFAFK